MYSSIINYNYVTYFLHPHSKLLWCRPQKAEALSSMLGLPVGSLLQLQPSDILNMIKHINIKTI